MIPRPYWFQPATSNATRFRLEDLGMRPDLRGAQRWRNLLKQKRIFAYGPVNTSVTVTIPAKVARAQLTPSTEHENPQLENHR
jgi:hypothetical protein